MNPHKIDPRRRPTTEEIAARALQIYVAGGCAEGPSQLHWLQAERELVTEAAPRSLRYYEATIGPDAYMLEPWELEAFSVVSARGVSRSEAA